VYIFGEKHGKRIQGLLCLEKEKCGWERKTKSKIIIIKICYLSQTFVFTVLLFVFVFPQTVHKIKLTK